ncbi:NADPH-dependent F420 reductase [Microlunatus sp. Gsoil 973]|uniref:NADPH-dependent F420 reductase n=1 Tax=Microlunatus sp. Gsoil 973 TaxID=2672569 RepID=UPI0012B4EE3E|nr:NAD(P)-binding domain-containing protein [Microlunatus sp. Gsoil 973]QGN33576.1 NADP oxidoreductase [Microlunatus sp. Gsoil 973]
MTTIGIIGSGNIGSTVARAAIAHDYDVVIANSRGPQSLQDLVGELGPKAAAGTVEEAARAGDLVLVAIPLKAIGALPPEPFDGKIVIDANNYYPQRDGQIAELDDESTTTSELLQRQLPGAKVVKAFNHIMAPEILSTATDPGTSGRRALIVAGDDQAAKDEVAAFIDTIGFDVLDIGELAEGWRIQRDTPGYVGRLDSAGLRQSVEAAKRYRDM